MNNPVKRSLVYRSAVDRWVVLLLAISPCVSVAIGCWLWMDGQPGSASILFGVGAVVALITVAFTCPCRYTLLEDTLSIRCGLAVFYQVAYADLVSVEPTSTWRSGPAHSLKRVAIKTKQRLIILSPEDREKFIRDLEERIAAISSP